MNIKTVDASIVCRMRRGSFLVQNKATRPSPTSHRLYVRPWADDDNDDVDAGCHGDDVTAARSTGDVTRRPFGVIASNFVSASPSVLAASTAGIQSFISPQNVIAKKNKKRT